MEKNSLMIDMQKCNMEISQLEAEVTQKQNKLRTLPSELASKISDEKNRQLSAFQQKLAKQKKTINDIVQRKVKEASDLLDTFPNLETKEFAGRCEIKSIEEHLKILYPDALIDNYVCLNLIEFEDDSEAFQVYSKLEFSVYSLRAGKLSGAIFNGLTSILDKAADIPKLGVKVVLVIAGAITFTLLVSPFLFLTVFSILGIASAIQGLRVQKILRRLYSIKKYLNTSYEVDIFERDKSDIMSNVTDFLSEVEQEYLSTVNSQVFKLNEDQIKKLESNSQLEEAKLKQDIALATQRIEDLKVRLDEMCKQLEELEESEKKAAAVAKKNFLETITWDRAWLDQILVDVVGGTQIKVMPFTKGVSLYYSENAQPLQELSRLVVMQCLTHMHPEFARNIVLDYKYNGGQLTQFLRFPESCCKICYTTDQVSKQVESTVNDIEARTNNILGSCESIEEFNALMKTYDAPGEYYVILHIFGLDSMASSILNIIRNGPRVGYFTKLYLTLEELQSLKDNLPLRSINDFFEVTRNPIPRQVAAVSRQIGAT